MHHGVGHGALLVLANTVIRAAMMPFMRAVGRRSSPTGPTADGKPLRATEVR